MKNAPWLLILTLIASLAVSQPASEAAVPTIQWSRQLGTSDFDRSMGVSADGVGSVYIAGYTEGDLGDANAGPADAFVSKYDASGSLLWSQQLGSGANDEGLGVSADGLGNVYITGPTGGSLDGTNFGSDDAFVSKYSESGSLLWTRQLGTDVFDQSSGLSADGLGNVYITGYTLGSLDETNFGSADAFVSKYDASGDLLWIRQLGTTQRDQSSAVSADGLGNVYISGTTDGDLDGTNHGSWDAFVSKFDASGSLLWTQQLGTSEFDRSTAISADGQGNVYIAGRTFGSLGGEIAGDEDAFVAKYDGTGNLLWIRQIGTEVRERGLGVSADGLGNVYLAGRTRGSLQGTNAGLEDAFVTKYSASGDLLWTAQMGTNGLDQGRGVSADGLGNVYLSGFTEGSLGGDSFGSWDAYLIKLDAVLPGDFDDDGHIDGADFLIWQSSFLNDDGGDADGDGDTDGDDFLIWQSNFGSGNGTASGTVPEPSSLLLFLTVWLVGLCVTAGKRRLLPFSAVRVGKQRPRSA